MSDGPSHTLTAISLSHPPADPIFDRGSDILLYRVELARANRGQRGLSPCPCSRLRQRLRSISPAPYGGDHRASGIVQIVARCAPGTHCEVLTKISSKRYMLTMYARKAAEPRRVPNIRWSSSSETSGRRCSYHRSSVRTGHAVCANETCTATSYICPTYMRRYSRTLCRLRHRRPRRGETGHSYVKRAGFPQKLSSHDNVVNYYTRSLCCCIRGYRAIRAIGDRMRQAMYRCPLETTRVKSIVFSTRDVPMREWTWSSLHHRVGNVGCAHTDMDTHR